MSSEVWTPPEPSTIWRYSVMDAEAYLGRKLRDGERERMAKAIDNSTAMESIMTVLDQFQDDRESVNMVKISDVRPGMFLNLENDPYADPPDASDRPPGGGPLTYEYAVVSSVIVETPECILIHFENADSCGFPPDHEVQVDSEALPNLWAVDAAGTLDLQPGEQYPIIAWFGSHEEAAEYISTLPNHETGCYGITGPGEDG